MTGSKRILLLVLAAVIIVVGILVAIFALTPDSESGAKPDLEDSKLPEEESFKMDPFDYLEITFEGYDGIGTVYIEFDDYAIDEKIFGPEPEDMLEFFEWNAQFEDFEGYIEYECSKEEGLSNGEKITITFNVTDDYKKYILEKEKEITVKGLTETKKYDFFANIELAYDGTEGGADVEIIKLLESEEMDACLFSCSPKWDVSEGTVVTVSIYNPETLAELFNIVPLESSKEFIVPALPKYASSATQIPTETVKEFAEKFVRAEQKENDEDTSILYSYSPAEFYSAYFLKGVSDGILVDKNQLVIIVKYDEYRKGNFNRTIYSILEYSDILINPDFSVTLEYDDGSNATFTTDIEARLEDYKEDYEVYEIVVD